MVGHGGGEVNARGRRREVPRGATLARVQGRIAAWVVVVACSVAATARAHQGSVTRVDVAVRGAEVHARVGVAALDLAECVGMSPGFELSREEALASREEVARYIRAGLRFSAAGVPCTAEGATSAALIDEGLRWRMELALRWRCGAGALRVRDDLFFAADPRHRAVLTVRAGDAARTVLLDGARRETALGDGSSPARVLTRFVAMGAEHVLSGWDHLALLAALLSAAAARSLRASWREVVALVTAFTAAHSLTLAAAALRWVTPPARVVEVAIALSILYVSAENARRAPPRGRAAVTFGFGLVHGLGFAGGLAEVGVPADSVAPALLGFNVGVELGQLAALALGWPLLRGCALVLGPLPARRALGVVLGALALGWTVARLR
jgi:hypothetical protein